MARSPATVLTELLAIGPQGESLPGDAPDAVWPVFLAPLASEISRFEGFAEAIETEVDPEDADYLLADYERVLGPDPYGRDAGVLTVQQRQQLAYQRWTARGGASVAYFIALAASVGVTITITEIRTFVAGRSRCGQTLVETPGQYAWLVTLPRTVVTPFRCGASRCGEGLGSFSASPAQALLAALAPAHTLPVFSYTG